jgi:hypothetical protein
VLGQSNFKLKEKNKVPYRAPPGPTHNPRQPKPPLHLWGLDLGPTCSMLHATRDKRLCSTPSSSDSIFKQVTGLGEATSSISTDDFGVDAPWRMECIATPPTHRPALPNKASQRVAQSRQAHIKVASRASGTACQRCGCALAKLKDGETKITKLNRQS